MILCYRVKVALPSYGKSENGDKRIFYDMERTPLHLNLFAPSLLVHLQFQGVCRQNGCCSSEVFCYCTTKNYPLKMQVSSKGVKATTMTPNQRYDLSSYYVSVAIILCSCTTYLYVSARHTINIPFLHNTLLYVSARHIFSIINTLIIVVIVIPFSI